MSYNTRNYSTRQSGGGRQQQYNSAGQFVPAADSAAVNPPPPPAPAQRGPRANTIVVSNADYSQMYSPSQQQPQSDYQQQQQPFGGQDVEMKTENAEYADGNGAEKPAWMKSKLQGVKKVSNKERRRRQNETLRRLLSPKNAVMVLNEVMPGEQIANQFRVEQAPSNFFGAQNFAAEITLEGQSFKAFGENKMTARSKAAEQAFRDLMVKRMTKALNQDGTGNGEAEGEEEEPLPMIQLASFALHKLFCEWECEGVKVPHLRGPAAAGGAGGGDNMSVSGEGARKAKPAKPAKTPVNKALPVNAASMHPAMLISYMRPRAEYRELAASGLKPQEMSFTVAVDVDNQTFTGTARNKKEARRAAAAAACEALFQMKFEPNASAATPIPAKQ